MKLRRLNETKKHFPLWLDKSENSNFSKHLSVVNEQNLDLYNSLKKLEFARLLEKPIQIIKKQSEPYIYELTFKVNIPYLKRITIYKNPIYSDEVTYVDDFQYNFTINDETIVGESPFEFEDDGTDKFSYTLIVSNDNEVIPSDKFLIKVETWDNHVFYKGYPENDVNDYSINIEHSKITNRNVLAFSCVAKNIKRVKITRKSKNDELDYQILSQSYIKPKNRFRYVYRLDVDEFINNYSYTFDVFLQDNIDYLTTTYPKAKSDFNDLFNHDASLDLIGKALNIPRHKYVINDETDLSKTYPKYYNNFTEDDYHYQERIKYYINHYNRTYFPVLEIWKNYGVESSLINRYKIIAEQNISYQSDDDKNWNKTDYNILPNTEIFYKYYDANHPSDNDGYYLIGATDKYDKVVPDTTKYYYMTEIIYLIDESDPVQVETRKQYIENHLYKLHKYNSSSDTEPTLVTTLTSHTIAPNVDLVITESSQTNQLINIQQDTSYILSSKTSKQDTSTYYIKKLDENYKLIKEYVNHIQVDIEYYNNKEELLSSETKEIIQDENEIEIYVPKNVIKCKITLNSTDGFNYTYFNLNRLINDENREYMRTHTDYNSCVYDLYINYEDIPSNIKLPTDGEFDLNFNKTFPLSKKGICHIDRHVSANGFVEVKGKAEAKIINSIPLSYRTIDDEVIDDEYTISNVLVEPNKKYMLSIHSDDCENLNIEITFYNGNVAISPAYTSNQLTTISEAEYYTELTTPNNATKCTIVINQDILVPTNFKYSNLKFCEKNPKNYLTY